VYTREYLNGVFFEFVTLTLNESLFSLQKTTADSSYPHTKQIQRKANEAQSLASDPVFFLGGGRLETQ